MTAVSLARSVPPLYAPFEGSIHPDHEAIDAECGAWLRGFDFGGDLSERLAKHDIGGFASRLFPSADRNRVRIMADFVGWLFGYDDYHCEEGKIGTSPGELAAMSARTAYVIGNPEAAVLTGDPLADALRDVVRRIRIFATPAHLARWTRSVLEYFLASSWEARHRRMETLPTLDEYAILRLYVGAASTIPPMMEMAYGYELPAREHDRADVRAITEAASILIDWCNDVLSHHKEVDSGRYVINVVRVLENTGLSTEAALSEAARQHDRIMSLFVVMLERARKSAEPLLRRYLDDLATVVRGSMDWHRHSYRYASARDSDVPAFRDHLDPEFATPLDIGPITWWWRTL